MYCMMKTTELIMKKILVIILFSLLSISLYSQNKVPKDVHYITELKIINNNLYPILDSIINITSRVPYYKGNTLFTIWFDLTWEGLEKYGLDSIMPDWISFEAEGNGTFIPRKDLGLFDYKGNTFFVRGDSLRTTIFSKKEIKRKIDSFKFGSSRKRFDKEGTLMLYYDELHDVYCSSLYRYKDAKFIFLQFSCFDDSVPVINNMDKEYPQK